MSLWALYVLVINVVLSTSLFTSLFEHAFLNRQASLLNVEYERAWSIWPTHIHAHHVLIRGSDSHVQWLLTLDDVTFDMSLLALRDRRFQVNEARGSGISMRIQQKLKTAPDVVEEIADLPPMAGLPAFAVTPAGPPSPELWDDDAYHLMSVDLEHVVAADVREVWLDRIRFAGHARIAGRFHLKPYREVDIGPVHVDIDSGEIDVGRARRVADDVHGILDVVAYRFDPRAVHENQVLRYFDVWTDVHARFEDLARMPFPSPAGVYAAGAVESQLRLAVERGILKEGTDITAESPRLWFARDGYMAETRLQVHASVNGALHAETHFSPLRVTRSDKTELLRTQSLFVAADSSKLDLAERPFTDAHLAVELDAATIEDGRVFNCILPCTVQLRAGAGEFKAHADIWPVDKRVSADAQLDYEHVRAALPTFEAAGSGTIALSFSDYRWDTDIVRDAQLTGHFRSSTLKGDATPLRRAHITDGAVSISLPKFELKDPLKSLDAEVSISEGSPVDIEVAGGGARMSGRTTIAINGHLLFQNRRLERANGHLLLRARDLALNKTGFDVRAGATVNANVDMEGRRVNVRSSRFELRAVSASLGGRPAFTADEIEVDGAAHHLDPRAPKLSAIAAHAQVRGLRAPDVKVFQQLLGATSKIRITDGAVRADGELAVDGIVTGEVRAGGEHLAVVRDKSTLRGDVVVEAKVIGVSDHGVDLDDSHVALRNVSLTNAPEATSGWQGDVDVKNGVVEWSSGTPAFDADLVLTADDARPILGMLETPKLVAGLVTMPKLKLVAHVDADREGLLLRDLRATGGNVAFRGSYAIRDGDKRGAFIVEKGPVTIGLRVGNDGVHPKLFGLDDWLGKEERKVKAAPQRREEAPGKP